MLAAGPSARAARSTRRWKPAGRATSVGGALRRAAGVDLLQHAQDDDLRRIERGAAQHRRANRAGELTWTSTSPTTRRCCATRCAAGSSKGYDFERRRGDRQGRRLRARRVAGDRRPRPDRPAGAGGARRPGLRPGRRDGGDGGARPRPRPRAVRRRRAGRDQRCSAGHEAAAAPRGCRTSPRARSSSSWRTRSAQSRYRLAHVETTAHGSGDAWRLSGTQDRRAGRRRGRRLHRAGARQRRRRRRGRHRPLPRLARAARRRGARATRRRTARAPPSWC